MPMCGVQAGHARTSATATPKGRASRTGNGAVFSSPLWTWCERFNRPGSSWKMCRASSRRIRAPRLSQLSTKWKKLGIWGGGLRAMHATSASPRIASVSSLSGILEETVPIASLLTAANCAGIIRREENNGRTVSARFRKALDETIRLWCNVGEALGTPESVVFAPRYVPKAESIREVIRTGQYSVARNLTWREWERLMGLPDDWTVVVDD